MHWMAFKTHEPLRALYWMWDAIKVGPVIQEWVAVDHFCCCGVISHGKGNINGVITSSWPDTMCLHFWNPMMRTDARRKTLPLEIIPPPSHIAVCVFLFTIGNLFSIFCVPLSLTLEAISWSVCSLVVGRWKATCSLLPKQSCLCFSEGLLALMKEELVVGDAVFLQKECKGRALTFRLQWWCLLVNT